LSSRSASTRNVGSFNRSSAALALRFLQNECRLHLGEGVSNCKLLAVKVYGVPPGPEEFSLSHSSAEC
jgi:hypothetical protein